MRSLNSLFIISIPYGTIKTLGVLSYIFFFDSISIPYGTIKTKSGQLIGLDTQNFNSLWYD